MEPCPIGFLCKTPGGPWTPVWSEATPNIARSLLALLSGPTAAAVFSTSLTRERAHRDIGAGQDSRVNAQATQEVQTAPGLQDLWLSAGAGSTLHHQPTTPRAGRQPKDADAARPRRKR
ncbi:hypothetical protein INR49_024917, partial [Caranx melampygus]